MKFNTCCALFAAALSLYLYFLSRSRGGKYGWIAYTLCTFTFSLGLATTFEYVFSINLGIDELIVSDFPSEESRAYPGRMSPIASFCFILLGGSLLLLHHRSKILSLPIYLLPLVPMTFVTFLAIVGYLYGVNSFYQLGQYIRISLPTSICLLVLSAGILFFRLNEYPTRILLDKGSAGIVARRLLPAVLFMPLLLGWIRLQLQYSGYVGLELGTAYLIVTIITLFAGLIFISALAINRVERERVSLVEMLKEAVKSRDDFLSIASHELKTPLTSLKIQTHIRKRKIGEFNLGDAEYEQLYKMFTSDDRQVDRLNRLIDDMLDISRINSGRLILHKEEINLKEVLYEIVDRFHNQYPSQIIDIQFDRDEPVFGLWDHLRLEQVFVNLLTNAIKYGQKQPIEVTLERIGGNLVRVGIRDYGPGIATEDQKRIFKRFERAVSANEVSGLGLGLFIAEEIVDLHRGRIWVDSKRGFGATFFVELPIEAVSNSSTMG